MNEVAFRGRTFILLLLSLCSLNAAHTVATLSKLCWPEAEPQSDPQSAERNSRPSPLNRRVSESSTPVKEKTLPPSGQDAAAAYIELTLPLSFFYNRLYSNRGLFNIVQAKDPQTGGEM
ncbi:unnamed protein product [Pleuronectes platessa]|uniref:Uncharacterized protein n=1 Tax=Pleuronectes platessa TaxID=8262 RepID=A0A9N7W525_PLEPL|nr:unnamed protein product [Pleuronectes platessa]